MRKLIGVAAVAALASTALALPIPEVEPNDTFGTAQVLPGNFFDPYGAGAVEGSLTAANVDFYAVNLPANTLVTFDVRDATGQLDTYIGAFRPDGTLHDFDDDDGPGLNSALVFNTGANAGAWRLAVTGFGDPDFNGSGHSQNGAYRLVASIPEPASLGLLLAGACMLIRRR